MSIGNAGARSSQYGTTEPIATATMRRHVDFRVDFRVAFLGAILTATASASSRPGRLSHQAMNAETSSDPNLAEAIRQALLEAARKAYDDARMQGLCAEGAVEVACGAMRALDLSAFAAGLPPPPT
jgi:hypothetical protein